MTRRLKCSDLGFDCTGIVQAETDEEILAQVAQHARESHGIEVLTDEMVAQAKLVIDVVQADRLATVVASSRLANQPGRAIINARGHYLVVDSPPSLGGPNEELNPLDLLLGALATCATFVCETAAAERDIPLESIMVTTVGNFDPRGVCGEPVNPRVQVFRVKLTMTGPNREQAEQLAEAFTQRCPVYTTLSRAADIEMEVTV